MTKRLIYFSDISRHLVCSPYSVENLHEMARDLSLDPCWYHSGDKPHYDIPKRRLAEIAAKSMVVSSKQIVRIIRDGQGGK